jgi:hypothetical protein
MEESWSVPWRPMYEFEFSLPDLAHARMHPLYDNIQSKICSWIEAIHLGRYFYAELVQIRLSVHVVPCALRKHVFNLPEQTARKSLKQKYVAEIPKQKSTSTVVSVSSHPEGSD